MVDKTQEKVEDKIIDLIVLGAGSRVVVFKPENSDKDLIAEKRSNYVDKTLSFNVYNGNFSSAQDFDKAIISSPSGLGLNLEKNFYLIFARFDIIRQDIDDKFWVVPSLSLEAAIDKDDFSKFLTNKKDFVRFLIDELGKK